ncbi:MAG: hypothetical protein QOK40_2273 [Miltoncostaeaceae bacterium]|nr:hypothetical protein [Miltoncostaeaceae bacterium]
MKSDELLLKMPSGCYARVRMMSADREAPKAEALDLLVEQTKSIFEIHEARLNAAESKAAAVLTADIALAALTVTAAKAVQHVSQTAALVVLAPLVLSAIAATIARSAAGLHRGHSTPTMSRPRLTRESDTAAATVAALRECGPDADPNEVRRLSLEVWRARQLDAYNASGDKELFAAIAGVLFVGALACAVVFGVLVIQSG